MKVWRSSTSVWSRASARASSSVGVIWRLAGSAATAIELLVGVCELEAARRHEDRQVVQDVRGLLRQPLVGLLRSRARSLVGLLAHLVADAWRIAQQLRGVAALGPLLAPARDRPLEPWKGLVRRGWLDLSVVEARALAGVAGRPGGLDERQHRVVVAVDAQLADALNVPGRLALVPQLVARPAPEVCLACCARTLERLPGHLGERQHLTGAPVLDDARDQSALVKRDFLHAGRF